MNNVKSFEEVYENLKQNNENKMKEIYEEAKKENKKRNKVALSMCLVVDLIAVAIFILKVKTNNIVPEFGLNKIINYFPFLIAFIVINIMMFLIASLFFRKQAMEYSKMFKELLVHDLLLNFFTELEYAPNSGISERVYEEGKYKEYYNRYYSDDYIEAKLNDINEINMAEVTTEHEETTTDSEGHTHTETTTIFSGLFAKLKLDKSIGTDLRIEENRLFNSKNKLNMDSQEFEKCFDVACENKIIGMQMLTADVMEKLVNFLKASSIRFDIYIHEDTMYIRFHSGKMFESRMEKNEVIPSKPLQKYYNILKFVYEISEEIILTVNSVEL